MKTVPVVAALLFSALAAPASALERLTLGTPEALSGVPEIIVPSGHSVVLEFKNGHFIQSVWVDDQSILAVATERPLCPRAGGRSTDSCGFASLLRLRRLSGALAIPGTSFSQGGDPSTVLTVLTTDRAGGNPQTYQFTVVTTDQRPSPYSHISILPTQSRQAYDLNAIERGIQVAIRDGLADHDSIEWSRLNRFLQLVQSQVPMALAMDHSAVSPELLQALERLGVPSAPSALPL